METKISDFRNAAAVEPMSKQTSDLFTAAALHEALGDKNNLELFDSAKAAKAGFAGQVLQRRLEVMSPNTKITLAVGAIATHLSCGNPGRAVLWAYTFHRMAKGSDWKLITVDDFAKAFPYGFPDDVSFERLWDAQKGGDNNLTHNLLDVVETWA